MSNAAGPIASLGADANVLVFGASGGIGNALVDHARKAPNVHRVWAVSRRGAGIADDTVRHLMADITDETSVRSVAELIGEEHMPVHCAIVATGVLHDDNGLQPEKTWRAIEPESMASAFAVNATGPALVAKHILPLLAKDQKAVFAAISARVGSISDNQAGGWYAYRASKAALNMLVKTFSIELARKNPTAICVGLHPGTVETTLSAPFRRNVADGKLFQPTDSAAKLLSVLDNLSPADSGRCVAWDGSAIEP